MLSFGLGYPFGAFVGGLVASVFDARAGVIAGAVVLIGGAVAAWLSPMRRLAITAGEPAVSEEPEVPAATP